MIVKKQKNKKNSLNVSMESLKFIKMIRMTCCLNKRSATGIFDRKKGVIIERLIESHRLARQLVNQNCSNLLFFFPDFLH